MTRVMQSIKNITLFLFSMALLVFGYKVNVAYAQTKTDVVDGKPCEMVGKPQTAEMSDKLGETGEEASKKSRTKVEKAKPERAHASKAYKKKSNSKKRHGPRK